ncbi:MAG: AAA family ATPase [Candidatus Nanohalobium sp.]
MTEDEYGSLPDPLERSSYEEVSSEDFVGLEHTQEFVDKVATYMNNLDYFQEHDAEFPSGVVFVGKRGTGKTMMSRYAATETDGAFVDAQQFDWNDRSPTHEVDEVYEAATQHYEDTGEPVMLFQDEFDDVFDINGHGKSDQATKLMQQLSGAEGSSSPGVFFMGTANEIPPDNDDSGRALFRKGRLEAYHFATPSQEQRQDLIDHYVDEKYDSHDVDAEALSMMFNDGATPAEIEALVNQAYTNAVMRGLENGGGDPTVTTEDLASELVQDRLKQKNDVTRSEEEREKTAVHEAGHYHVADEVGIGTPIVTIEPQIESLGQTYLVDPDSSMDFNKALDYGAAMVGGYVAERRNGYDPMGGLAGDLKKLDNLAGQAEKVMDIDSFYQTYVDGDTDRNVEPVLNRDELEKMQRKMGMEDSEMEQILGTLDILNSADRGKIPLGAGAFKASALQRADEILEEKEYSGQFQQTVDTLVDEETVMGRELP